MNQEFLNRIIAQIQDMADLAEEKIIFHDVNLEQIRFHRGKLEAYEELIALLEPYMGKRRAALEV